jgi:hypothetical protein
MAPTPRHAHTHSSAPALPQPCQIRARQPYLVRAVNLGQPDLGGILDRTEGLAEALLRRHPQSPRPPSLLQSARTSERHRSDQRCAALPLRDRLPCHHHPRSLAPPRLNPDPPPRPCASHPCAPPASLQRSLPPRSCARTRATTASCCCAWGERESVVTMAMAFGGAKAYARCSTCVSTGSIKSVPMSSSQRLSHRTPSLPSVLRARAPHCAALARFRSLARWLCLAVSRVGASAARVASPSCCSADVLRADMLGAW